MKVVFAEDPHDLNEHCREVGKKLGAPLLQQPANLKQATNDLKSSREESHHRLLELEVLYHTAPVGLGFLDDELRYVRLNEALAEINGISMRAHIGRHASDINPPLANMVVPMMARVIASRQPRINVEIRAAIPTDIAHERTWIVNLHPVANGKTFGVSVAFQDITFLKETEDIRRHFSLIVESSDDPMISMNLDGGITSWNRAAESLFDYSAREVMGKKISMLATPQYAHELPDILGRLQLGDRAGHYETVHRRKDGRHVDVSLTVSPIHDLEGNIIGASQTVRDMTEQKHAYAALLQSNEELREFAFVAAHDLQEPLRNISLSAQMLQINRQNNEDGKPGDHLATVIDSARRMQTLIKDLLQYTEVVEFDGETGQTIDCNEVCRWALENLAAAMADSKAIVNVAPLPTLVAARTHLMQLFQNLIGNALKYRSKERQVQISVAADRRDDNWIFSVKDNGIGIAPAYHERIFGVFKRLHGRDVPGTGIGLAICKRIVGHHGGRLWLESEVGRGSTFYFSFPIRN